MLEILKAGKVSGVAVNDFELSEINKFTLEPLDGESVYAFKVTACGNEIDRDGEAFTTKSIETLAGLFIGKTVVQDHNPKSENQLARIYRTEIVPCADMTKTGEAHVQLAVYCYMVKTDGNKDLIIEIKAGIKKEVSVGCAVGKITCSVCGKDNRIISCVHLAGETYDGLICYKKLEDPVDAYELSFVAVPAQPEAGVTKDYGGKPEHSIKQTIADRFKAAFLKTED